VLHTTLFKSNTTTAKVSLPLEASHVSCSLFAVKFHWRANSSVPARADVTELRAFRMRGAIFTSFLKQIGRYMYKENGSKAFFFLNNLSVSFLCFSQIYESSL